MGKNKIVKYSIGCMWVIVMTVAMVIGFLPYMSVTTYANDDVVSVTTETESGTVTDNYSSIDKAFEAASNCSVIKLLSDVTVGK